MSNRQATYTINLNNNVIRSLEQTESAALRLDGVMGELKTTMNLFGAAFGASLLIDKAEDWIKSAATYEQAMLRIKNASADTYEGLRNQLFITGLTDKFKVDLQTTADAWGNFLLKIKNAGLSSNTERHLYENLMTISKVAGLPQSEMESTIRNISIMLGEGVLEARHLRALSYVHPQIIPFLSEQLGLKGESEKMFSKMLKHDTSEETAGQMFSQLISSGKLTKLGLNANLIVGAVEKYTQSVKGGLPETLQTVESELNTLHNTWLKFKNSLTLSQKHEVVEFFHELGTGIKYLSDHSDQIISFGKEMLNLLKLYAEWRIALMALQAPFAIISFFRNEYGRLTGVLGLYTSALNINSAAVTANTGFVSAQTLASNAQAAAYYAEVEAITILNAEMEAMAVKMTWFNTSAGISTFAPAALLGSGQKQLAAGAAAGTWSRGAAGAAAGTAAAYEEATIVGAGATALGGVSILGGALLVALTAASIYGISQLLKDNKEHDDQRNPTDERRWKETMYAMQHTTDTSGWGDDGKLRQLKATLEAYQVNIPFEEFQKANEAFREGSGIKDLNIYDAFIQAFEKTVPTPQTVVSWLHMYDKPETDEDKKNKNKNRLDPNATSRLRGNSVTNIHISWTGGMNGMVNPKFTVNNMADMQEIEDKVGTILVKKLTDAINDAQYLHK